MKLFKENNNFLKIFFVAFSFILLSVFIYQIVIGYSKESWQITEWLINYQGGFVRRGLWGEIIFNIYNYCGISPYLIIITFSAAFYFIFLTIFVKLFIKNGYSLFLLPFAFFLGGPIINNFWVRKDILIILLFSLIIYLSKKLTNINIIFINILFIIGLLTHESIIFFGFPILFLIFYKNNLLKFLKNKIKAVFFSFLQLLPLISVFILCTYYKGSYIISKIIWDSWKNANFPMQDKSLIEPQAAIDGLSWSLKKGISLFFDLFHNFNYGIYAPIAWIVIFLLIYFILSNFNIINIKIFNYKLTEKINKKNISNILVWQFISITPLFVFGWDYGRWVFIWTTSSFLIFLLLPEKKILNIFPRCISNISLKFNNILDYIFRKKQKFISILVFLLGVPVCSWSLLYYFSSIPIGVLLKLIIKLFYL